MFGAISFLDTIDVYEHRRAKDSRDDVVLLSCNEIVIAFAKGGLVLASTTNAEPQRSGPVVVVHDNVVVLLTVAALKQPRVEVEFEPRDDAFNRDRTTYENRTEVQRDVLPRGARVTTHHNSRRRSCCSVHERSIDAPNRVHDRIFLRVHKVPVVFKNRERCAVHLEHSLVVHVSRVNLD